MTSSTGQRTSRPSPPDPPLIGSFGWVEEPRPAEVCPEHDCPPALPTDLYCVEHDRFLPFVEGWTNIGKIAAVLTVSALLLSGFVFTAELNSWLPVFLAYAILGLGVVVLPLRRFTITARTTTVVWAGACCVALIYQSRDMHVRGVIGAWLVATGAVVVALHAVPAAAHAALDDRFVGNSKDRPRRVLAFVSGTFVVMAISALLHVGPLSSGGRYAASVIALVALAAGVVAAVRAGMIDGAPRIDRNVWRWRAPTSAWQVGWRAHPKAVQHWQTTKTIERIGELVRRSLLHAGNAVKVAAFGAARTTANLLLTAWYLLQCFFIYCINQIIRGAVLMARAIWAGLLSAIWLLVRSLAVALFHLAYTLISMAIPVAMLAIAAGLEILASEQTRQYLIGGSLISLLQLAVTAAAAIGALTVAWLVLAGQPRRLSLRSAFRSANITGPYAIILIAVGGWIIGLPGTLGPGRIHVGWLTLTSTTLLAGAFLWTQLSNHESIQEAGMHSK
ncbi:MAG: hypothetical protein JWN00_5617 [Actinomycetia bacterium]|nr:hypothetical protein [Actinomycetes bacterium]